MPWAPIAGAAIGAVGSIYAANKASKGMSSAADAARPLPGYTSYGSSYAPGGLTRIDPSIRAMRHASLENLPGYRGGLMDAYGGLQGQFGNQQAQFGDLYGRLQSNENPFIQARVNPLMARAAQGRGLLERSLARRGLAGSSLASGAISQFNVPMEREIADQRSIATQESLGAQRAVLQDMGGLSTQRYNAALSQVQALQGLDSAQQEVAAQDLQQELASLGLSQAQIQGILGAAGLQMQASQLKADMYGRTADILGRGLESYLSNRSGSSTPQYSTGRF